MEEQWSGIGATIKARSGEFRDYWRSNYDPASFATAQRGPLMYLNSTNDFFGQLTQAEQWLENVAVEHRRNYSPNQNHGLDPEAVAAGMAWFDAHLKESGQFPEEPRIELGLAEGGEIQATLHIDESRKVQEVRVDFSRGGRPDLLRCWISSEATRVEGGVWRARIPLVETVQPLALIPQVRYHEGFTLSGPLRELVPAIEFQKSKSSEQSTDIVSDWNNGPAGWFLPQGTDFFHADKATPHLTSGTLESRAALIFKAESVGGRVHLATRLLVDPLRNEGNRRALEFWTHDLKNGEIRTDWWTSQPGVIPCRASFEGGPGWRRNVIRLEDLSLITENSATPEGTVTPLGLWNDVQRLDIVADAIQDGTAAIGLMRWVEPSGGGFSLLTTPPDPQ